MLLRPAPLNRTKLRRRQFFSKLETETSSLAAHGELLFISGEAAREKPNQNKLDSVRSNRAIDWSGCQESKRVACPFCLLRMIFRLDMHHHRHLSVACRVPKGKRGTTTTEMQKTGVRGGGGVRETTVSTVQCSAVPLREKRKGFMLNQNASFCPLESKVSGGAFVPVAA